MNQVLIDGNLVEQPRVNTTRNGNTVANLRIAHNKPDRKDGSPGGAVFVSVECWNSLANAVTHMQKGAFLTIYGNMDQQSWQADDGSARSKIVIKAQAITGKGVAFAPDQMDYEPGTPRRQDAPRANTKPAQGWASNAPATEPVEAEVDERINF